MFELLHENKATILPYWELQKLVTIILLRDGGFTRTYSVL